MLTLENAVELARPWAIKLFEEKYFLSLLIKEPMFIKKGGIFSN